MGTKMIKYLARAIKLPTGTIKRPARPINGTKLETDLTPQTSPKNVGLKRFQIFEEQK